MENPKLTHAPVKLDQRLTLSISEAARLLGLKSKTFYNQLSAGSCPLPTVKFGGRRLIRVADLIQLLGDDEPRQHASHITKFSKHS